MNHNGNPIEARLWDAADELRANSKLKSSEYSVPVLGLVFLRYADHKFQHAAAQLGAGSRRRRIGPADYQALGVLYLPDEARFSQIIQLPEGSAIGGAINDAMRAIEAANPDLKDVLPKTYHRFENSLLKELLKTLNSIPMDIEGDAFGRIYEYFLGNFARAEGQKGGEFFTPTAIVQLIVGIIEPFRGRIYDPACGSGGMFVQSARFVEEHKRSPSAELSVYGQEKVAETVRLGKMNLAVHGLGGDIRQGNAYYEDLHRATDRFDFVMANSASDARGSELEIRRQLIESGAVEAMVAVGSNFFYTVTLPCTLWFLDRASDDVRESVLFIDARHIYRQIDRAHRDWTPAQIELLANIARLHRGKPPENLHDSAALLAGHFPDGRYVDVPGLCKAATLAEIEAQGWSLNPGRYVGVAARAEEDFDFKERMEELNEALEALNGEARELEERISENVAILLEAE